MRPRSQRFHRWAECDSIAGLKNTIFRRKYIQIYTIFRQKYIIDF
nr:MAG TPA: hypothetical protein [Caudoviricetes sp.]